MDGAWESLLSVSLLPCPCFVSQSSPLSPSSVSELFIFFFLLLPPIVEICLISLEIKNFVIKYDSDLKTVAYYMKGWVSNEIVSCLSHSPCFDSFFVIYFLRINCGFVFLFACCFTSFYPQLLLMLEGLVDERSRLNEALQAETALQQSGEVPCPSRGWESDCIVFLLFLITRRIPPHLQSGKKKKVGHYWGPICHSFVVPLSIIYN